MHLTVSVFFYTRKETYLNVNLCGTALFEEIGKFCVQYYVCVSTQATETKTKFGAHWLF